jgi:hypothetical protein
MTQPLGNCPGCGGDEPFEQVHAGGQYPGDQCPGDQCPDGTGECPEWMCTGCGAGVFLGLVVTGPVDASSASADSATPSRQSVRAA